MRLIPTLGLGPRRLVRRPIESTILFLAVALGTLGTVTAVDATFKLLKTTAEGAANPRLRDVSVFANNSIPRLAVYPQLLWRQAIDRYNQFPTDPRWLDPALPLLPPVETAYAKLASWAKVRTSAAAPWIDAPWSLCADPRVFALSGVDLVAGRAFTAAEWTSGARVTVLGRDLWEQLFPGVPPAQALGRTLEVSPIVGYEGLESVTIVGVCGQRAGSLPGSEGSADLWMALTWMPEIKPQYGRGLEFVFRTKTVDDVPGFLAALEAVTNQRADLRDQTIDSQYEGFRQERNLGTGIEILVLAVGGGTFLIALWTLGSVFRSRMPSMRKSLRLLRALGASRRTLVFLGLSEILPVALGGLFVGIAAALGIRHGLDVQVWFESYDPVLFPALLVCAVGFQFYQVVPALSESDTVAKGGLR